MSRRRRIVIAAVALLCGVAAAEGAARILLRASTSYTSAFTPGWSWYCVKPRPESPDLCPPRAYVMRVQPGFHFSAVQFDAMGYRPVQVGGPPPSPGAPPMRVLVFGGQSQGFGFGLADPDTMVAQAARHATRPVEFRPLSMVGLNDDANLALAGPMIAETKPRWVIHMVYWRNMLPIKTIAAVEKERESLLVVDGWQRDRFGLPDPLARLELVQAVATRTRALLPTLATAPGGPPPAAGGVALSRDDYIRRFDLVGDYRAHIEALGSRYALAILLKSADDSDSARLVAQVRGKVPVLDLERCAIAARLDRELLADGHYNPTLARFKGQALAHWIEELERAAAEGDPAARDYDCRPAAVGEPSPPPGRRSPGRVRGHSPG